MSDIRVQFFWKGACKNAPQLQRFWWVSFFLVVTIGCETPGSVGGSFIESGTEVEIDTFQVTNMQTDSLRTFSGNLSFFSAGAFDDPLFGNLNAIALIKPVLPRVSNRDSIGKDGEMKLRLAFDKSDIYGDTLATAEYELIEIEEIWRGRAWKLNDQIRLSQQGPVASFQVSEEDSLEVPLSSRWVARYRSFFNAVSANRDSLYTYDFNGLAIVPKNNAKILALDPNRTEFAIINPEEDTSRVGTLQWAYSLDRTNEPPAPQGSYKAISTLEKVLSFDLNLTLENLGTANISKVELVLHQNSEALDSSINQTSGSAVRPDVTTANLFLAEPSNLPEAISLGNPVAQGIYREADSTYRFDITSFTNAVLERGIGDGQAFYVTLQTNNGIIRSGLIYNNEASPEKQPKIIVTSIKSEGS